MKTFDEIQREAQLAKLRAELGDAFATWAVHQDRQMDVAPLQRPGDDVWRVNFSSGAVGNIREGNYDHGWVEPIEVDYIAHKRLPLSIIEPTTHEDIIKRLVGD